MSAKNLEHDGLYQLTTHADHLNSISTPNSSAIAKYELMSGALIWTDETNSETPVHVTWALRKLFAYRTKLMLHNAEPDNEFWDQCVKLFPNWIGFLTERRTPTPELLAEYRRGDVSTRWCLRQLDNEMDTDDT